MDDRADLARHWPLFGLSVRTPRLVLRYPTDGDLGALAALTADIHDPEARPFLVPWSIEPDGQRERTMLQWNWRARAEWRAERWRLEFAVVAGGEVVGVQGIGATAFPVARSVSSGSWLARRHQGQGLGTEARRAVLHLAFDGLGAAVAETGAFADNPASLAVARRLGYRSNGEKWLDRQGRRARELCFVMDRAGFERLRRPDVEIVGLEPCLGLFGLAGTGADPPG